MTKAVFAASICAVAVLTSCATKDVVFVSSTTIGIDGQTTPPSALNVGYDRTVGYIAPRFPNGTLPPVVASLQGDLGILTPQISQSYATGAAALALAGTGASVPATCPDAAMTIDHDDASSDLKVMYFSTSDVLGIKLGATSSGAALTVGFKRKEESIIPVGATSTGHAETDFYPAVLASVNLRISSLDPTKASVPLSEFFATGAVATCLAGDAEIRANFQGLAKAATAAVSAAASGSSTILAK